MKKMIYVCLLVIGMYSCKKETIENLAQQGSVTTPMYGGVSVEDGMLSFKTIKDYEALIDNGSEKHQELFLEYLKSLNFRSAAFKNSIYDDEFFKSLLNPDYTISIGDWIFKINEPDSSVYCLNKKHKSQIKDLLSLNTNNKNVLKYGFNEDVLDIVGIGGTGKNTEIQCSETSRSDQYKDWRNTYFNSGLNRLFIEHSYGNWGVYFRVEIACTFEAHQGGGSWIPYATDGYQVWISQIYTHRKPRCQEWESSWEYRLIEKMSSSKNRIVRKPYNRTRGLHKYLIRSAWGASTDNGVTWTDTPIYEISANYY